MHQPQRVDDIVHSTSSRAPQHHEEQQYKAGAFVDRLDDRPYNLDVNTEGLPGADLVETGVRDLDAGIESVAALLVSIGAPRLSRLGIEVRHPISSAEHRLYDLLSEDDVDSAHARYNALIRRLVSFERAAECQG